MTWINAPNLLTLLRLVVAVPAGILFSSADPLYSYWGLGLFVFAGVTDVLDGWIARMSRQITCVGKTLDPIADKVALSCLFLALTHRYEQLPELFAFIYVGKELAQLIVAAIIYSSVGSTMQANWLGKAATLLLYVGAALFYVGSAWWDAAREPGLVFLFAGLVFSFLAGANYLRNCLTNMSKPAARMKGE